MSGEKQLTLVDTFKLYVWTLWKSGIITDVQCAKACGFVDHLTPEDTMDKCFNDLLENNTFHVEIYSPEPKAAEPDLFTEVQTVAQPVMPSAQEPTT